VRIAAGGIQSILRLKSLLNPFASVLNFQYVSHRVLRWTVTPFFLILAFILNVAIAVQPGETFYQLLLAAQILFYFMSILGWLMEKRELRIKILFIPYYFCVMNYAVLAGIIRYIQKTQSAAWEKAERRQ
jgi:hypothetical protein